MRAMLLGSCIVARMQYMIPKMMRMCSRSLSRLICSLGQPEFERLRERLVGGKRYDV